MSRWVPTPEAYRLLHEGTLALSEVEAAGVRVDRAYLERAIRETSDKIKESEEQLRAQPEFRDWRRRYGEKTNISSPEQLAGLVFGVLGHPARKQTRKKKRDAADESAFSHVDLPLVKHYFAAAKLRKGRDTYLSGIHREMVQHTEGNCDVQPHYHLNTVATYRSSCSDPNWTNIPTRNPMLAEMVRRSYIPRPGWQLVEIDLGQIEVRIPCCYNFDPNLIRYVTDPKTDMHRDVGEQIFMLPAGRKMLSKEARHVAKNQFVFPTFYGSYYAKIAPHVWEAMERRNLKVEGTDKTLRQHLAERGITSLGDCNPERRPVPGTMEYHLKEIEDHFWGVRFKVYAEWKRRWLEDYRRDGGCRFLTGFVMTGPHKKNDITNYCIQGVAFHCALWSLIKIVRRLRKHRFRSKLIGEIHDCLNFDCHPRERDDVIYMARSVMTEEIRSWATWLNVPLVVEAEVCPVDRPWFDKAVVVERDGRWVPADEKKWESRYGDWSLQEVA